MKEKLKNIYSLLVTKELGILPGNLAYSFFLAIIPILSLLIYFLTSFNLPMSFLQTFLEETFPSSVAEFIQPVLTSDISFESFLTIWLSIVVMTNGCNAIIVASNTIYNFEN